MKTRTRIEDKDKKHGDSLIKFTADIARH